MPMGAMWDSNLRLQLIFGSEEHDNTRRARSEAYYRQSPLASSCDQKIIGEYITNVKSEDADKCRVVAWIHPRGVDNNDSELFALQETTPYSADSSASFHRFSWSYKFLSDRVACWHSRKCTYARASRLRCWFATSKVWRSGNHTREIQSGSCKSTE
jgi:hypothetical protein